MKSWPKSQTFHLELFRSKLEILGGNKFLSKESKFSESIILTKHVCKHHKNPILSIIVFTTVNCWFSRMQLSCCVGTVIVTRKIVKLLLFAIFCQIFQQNTTKNTTRGSSLALKIKM